MNEENYFSNELYGTMGIREVLTMILMNYTQHEIKKVIFNDPATIVFWDDGKKTVVKCGEGETFDPEKGLAMAICKRVLGNKGNYYEEFKKWLSKEK